MNKPLITSVKVDPLIHPDPSISVIVATVFFRSRTARVEIPVAKNCRIDMRALAHIVQCEVNKAVERNPPR